MGKAVYFQNGENLDFINNTESAIAAGDIVNLKNKIAVAGGNISPGATGSVISVGVFGILKTAGIALSAGDAVFYNSETGEATSDSSKTPAGIAVADSTAAETSVLVDISAGATALAIVLSMEAATASDTGENP